MSNYNYLADYDEFENYRYGSDGNISFEKFRTKVIAARDTETRTERHKFFKSGQTELYIPKRYVNVSQGKSARSALGPVLEEFGITDAPFEKRLVLSPLTWTRARRIYEQYHKKQGRSGVATFNDAMINGRDKANDLHSNLELTLGPLSVYGLERDYTSNYRADEKDTPFGVISTLEGASKKNVLRESKIYTNAVLPDQQARDDYIAGFLPHISFIKLRNRETAELIQSNIDDINEMTQFAGSMLVAGKAKLIAVTYSPIS